MMTPAFLRQLGRVTMNFARVEWNLAYAISGLIGPFAAGGQMVALELPFKKKCLLFGFACRHDSRLATQAASTEFRALMQRLSQCEHSLQQVTNPLWLAAPRDRHVRSEIRAGMTAMASKSLRTVQKSEALRVRMIADDMGKAADAIIPFMRRHLGGSRGRSGETRRPTRG